MQQAFPYGAQAVRRAVVPATFAALPVAIVVACKCALNLAFAGRYGWQRDELYYAVAGRHLQGGYVEFPAVTGLLSAAARILFGWSLASPSGDATCSGDASSRSPWSSLQRCSHRTSCGRHSMDGSAFTGSSTRRRAPPTSRGRSTSQTCSCSLTSWPCRWRLPAS